MDAVTQTETYKILPLDLLIECPFNPRTQLDTAALNELAQSIREQGVTTPILTRAMENGAGLQYEVVDGSRRVRAAQLAELKDIPAIVRTLTDAQCIEHALIATLQRENLHPLDEAHAFRRLMEVGKLKPPQIAKRVGKDDPQYVYKRLQLTRLTETAQVAFRAGDMQPTHALVLAPLNRADQLDALEYVVEKQPTVEQLHVWLNARKGKEDAGEDSDGEEADGNGAKDAKPERAPHAVTPKMIESFALSVGKIKAKDIAASEPLRAALRKLAENAGRVLIAGARVKPKRVHPRDLPDQHAINKRGARRAKAYLAKRKAAPRKK